jgi:molecular chaperone Hsp33
MNYIRKFVFDSIPVKGVFVELTDVWSKIARQKQYTPSIKQLLGELLTANILLTSSIKLDGKIVTQIHEIPNLDLVVSECSNQYKVRATAKFKEDSVITSMDYNSIVQSGRLVISIDSNSDGKLYQSIVELANKELAAIINGYMVQSEQLNSWVIISYSDDRIVALMLQQLPDVDNVNQENIEQIFLLAKTIKHQELLNIPYESLLSKVFINQDIVLYDKEIIAFECSCSSEKVANMLRAIGIEEVMSIIEEDKIIAVTCDFCNTEYKYQEQDIQVVFSNLSIHEECISQEIN